jgi:hypothetical protein
MEEGSGHGALPWAGHYGAHRPYKLVFESLATSSSVKTYWILLFLWRIHLLTDANTGEVWKLLTSDKWDPLILHALVQNKIWPREYLPDNVPFGKAQKLIVDALINPCGSIDYYIDNTAGLTINIPSTDNASQLKAAILLAIKEAAQPDDKNERIACKALVAKDKLLAEGGLLETKIIMWWLFNFRAITVSLPDH